MNIRWKLLNATFLFVLLAGCETPGIMGGWDGSAEDESESAEGAYVYTPRTDIPDSQRYVEALKLLEYGQEERAKVELEAYLARYPGRSKAQHMLDQIVMDPGDYYPFPAFVHRLEPGESLSTLSEKYLGDRMQFFALARYNQISNPRRVQAGQAIQIPLTPHAERVRANETSQASAEPEAAPPAADPAPPEPEPVEEAIAIEPEPVDSAVVQAADFAAAAQRSLTDGDKVGAMEQYSRAVELSPDNPDYQSALASAREDVIDQYHREALLAYRSQQLDPAIDLWNRLLELDPDHIDAQVYRSKAMDLKARLESRKSVQ